MTARLIQLGDAERSFELSAFSTLGRHPDNTVQVMDRIVSKEHARITLGGNGAYVIRDVGSLNGTFVNESKIDEHTLQNGDVLSLGSTKFRFEGGDAPRKELKQVKIGGDESHSEVQGSVSATLRFAPAAEVQDEAVLRADYEKLRIAHELSQKLAVDTDLDRILQQIVDETFQIISADRAVILLKDQDDELQVRHVRQKRDDEIKLSKTILGEVVRNRQAVLSSDAMMDDRFKTAKSIIMQGIRSTMTVPLLMKEEVLGVFHVDSSLTSGAFTQKDLMLMSGVATQAAIAIQNYRLAKKIEEEATARAQFQRLVSPNLVDQIVSGALDINQAGSQQEVTMLFADIRGFTAMSERHTPEEMVDTLNAYFEVMVDVLFRHGGTLDKYVGDEIIGLFGAPVAQPDSPLRAVRCGLDMLRALDEHNRMRAAQGKVDIQIGIGINTGLVIAGAIGSSQTLQYTVIGDAVNTAARLCGVAQAGEVIVSESTFAPLQDHAIAEARAPVTVKGKSQPLPIWRVTGMHEHAPPRQ